MKGPGDQANSGGKLAHRWKRSSQEQFALAAGCSGGAGERKAFGGARRDPMTATAILVWIIVGAVAGWLAGLLVRGFGFGLFGNIVIGILGAVLGGWLFGALGFSFLPGIVNSIITAFIGAVILLLVVRVLKRA
jgi:uncharacterized membrane protein YeaQ/YmgE (transglycosylase-associated protein family)